MIKLLISFFFLFNFTLYSKEIKKEKYDIYINNNHTLLENTDFEIYPKINTFENKNSIFIDLNNSDVYDKNNISSIFNKFNSKNKAYNKALGNQHTFLGLYFTGEYQHFLDKYENIGNEFYLDSSNKYGAGIRWDFFDKGYFKSKKEKEKKIVETRLENLQLRTQFIQHELNNRIFNSKLYLNEIDLIFNKQMLAIYKDIYKKRKNLMSTGFIDVEDVQNISMKIEFYQNYIDHYIRQERLSMDKDLFYFINNIEKVVLINKKEFIKMMKLDNIALKTQDVFKARADFFPEYIDNVRAYVYAKHEFLDYYGNQESIGFNIEIPIDMTPERDQLIRLQKERYNLNQEAIEVRLYQKVTYLYQHFSYINTRIKGMKSELNFLGKQRSNINKKLQMKLISQTESLIRKMDINRLDSTRLRHEIIKAKIENYLNFLNICNLINFKDIQTIIRIEGN